MKSWTPDHNGGIEETTESIDPLKDWGDGVDEGTHVVEDDYEKEFEELLKEEEENLNIKKNEIDKEISDKLKPVLKKTKHRTFKNSKLNLTKSTGGSRISALMGNDYDIEL
ncbi:MAG: hypothetical protein GX277_09730 [Bacteroidales bacterium]|nr:hypothetical protein [Bacteroidales bacterium]